MPRPSSAGPRGRGPRATRPGGPPPGPAEGASSEMADWTRPEYSRSLEALEIVLGQEHPLDAPRPAGLGIGVDHGRREAGIALGRLESRGHAGQEAVDDRVLLHADHRVVGPGHAEV